MNTPDDDFLKRANEHIDLSNQQLARASKGQVSASMLYGTARFNAWLSAAACEDVEQLKEAKAEVLQYFLKEYETMLSENLDNYIQNFDQFMRTEENGHGDS